MKPTVLLYNLPLSAQVQVEALCREIGAIPLVVEGSRQGLTLGALVGLLPERGSTERVSGQMLVMAYFEKGMLDAFLQGFRRRQIPPIPRKAMLTLTNTAWTGPQLYENLSQEMDAMAKSLQK
ncbi:MAG: DUF3783 domain-containing protein [Eubacteriales bacterium]|nr:DUF3783 domain-containing protein [Eubacteriales bacterium]